MQYVGDWEDKQRSLELFFNIVSRATEPVYRRKNMAGLFNKVAAKAGHRTESPKRTAKETERVAGNEFELTLEEEEKIKEEEERL